MHTYIIGRLLTAVAFDVASVVIKSVTNLCVDQTTIK